MKFLRSVAGYTWKDHIRNTKSREQPNIFNLINSIPKYRSQRKYHVQRIEYGRIAKKIITHTKKEDET
jgi:hypothetical protein